jgi:Protein of unknown function (DUF3306)
MTDKTEKSEGGFLSRWSRRKALQEKDAPGQGELVPPAPVMPAQPATTVMPSNPSTGAELQAHAAKTGANTGVSGNAALELPSIESLTSESDFTPFMAKDVPASLRNQAVKKLFADPRYGLIDQMDIYIADYTQPDPIPMEMLRMMHQSKALGLFDDDPDSPANDVAADESPAMEPAETAIEAAPISPPALVAPAEEFEAQQAVENVTHVKVSDVSKP